MWQILIHDGFLPFVIVGLIVIFSICVHELSHGFAALHQGDQTPAKTGHMTLNPVVHMGWEAIIFLFISGMAWGSMPVNPLRFRSAKWGEILVSAAGPLANLALSLLSVVIIKELFTLNAERLFNVALPLLQWTLFLMALINLKLFALNMLPIPPLDGFYIFSQFFPALKPLKDSPFGFAALMILFLSPFGTGLDMIAAWFVAHATSIPLNTFLPGFK